MTHSASSDDQSTKVFSPIDLGALHLNNRVAMAPLTRNRAGEDGVPSELHEEYYSQRASAGMIITEGVYPVRRSRGFVGQPGIENHAQQEGWRKVARAVHSRGGHIVMQIMHAGRMSHPDLTGGMQPEAPSAIAPGTEIHLADGKQPIPTPRELAHEDIAGVVREFAAAARRAVDAGLDGVEIHGANGYLLHEFLSPSSNRRTDEYGGAAGNRARLTIEVVRAVAKEIGAERTGLRLSPEHNIQGVIENDRADVLATYGAVLEGLDDLPLAFYSLLHRELDGDVIRHLRGITDRPVLLNSGFAQYTDLDEARYIIDELQADGVVVGRQLIANPDLVERWKTGAALNEADEATFYTPSAKGYTDYPFAP